MSSARDLSPHVRAGSGVTVALLVAATLLASCRTASVVYGGPRRPESEVARLQAARGTILEIDGVERFGSSFEVLPGKHDVVVSYHLRGEELAPNVRSEDLARFECRCQTTLAAGRRYRLEVEQSMPRGRRAFVTRYEHRVTLIDEGDARRIMMFAVCNRR